MPKSTLLNLVNWREARALQNCLSPLLNTLKLTLVDVGAAGDIEPRWRRIAPFVNYVGFEPDERSFMQLKDRRTDCADYKIHNAAVWSSKGVLDYNLCKGWQVSSHYKPNAELVLPFPNAERFDAEKNLKIPIHQLDEIVDGLFLRTPEAIAKLATSNPDKIRKYIAICGLYNRFDLIDRLVELCRDDHDWLAKAAELAPIRRRARRSHKIKKIAQLSLRMVGSEFKTHSLFRLARHRLLKQFATSQFS